MLKGNMRDMMEGHNNWENIQPVLRSTFQAIYTDLKELKTKHVQHKQNFQLFSRKIAGKLDATTLGGVHEQVHNNQNLVAALAMDVDDISKELKKKASMDYINEHLLLKANKSEAMTATPATRGSSSTSQDDRIRRICSRLEKLERNVEKLAGRQSKMEDRIMSKVAVMMDSARIQAQTDEAIRHDQNAAGMSEISALRQELDKFKSEYSSAMEGKANKASVASALHRKANKKDIAIALQDAVQNQPPIQSAGPKVAHGRSNTVMEMLEQLDGLQAQMDHLKRELKRKTTEDDMDKFVQKISHHVSERVGELQRQNDLQAEKIASVERGVQAYSRRVSNTMQTGMNEVVENLKGRMALMQRQFQNAQDQQRAECEDIRAQAKNALTRARAVEQKVGNQMSLGAIENLFKQQQQQQMLQQQQVASQITTPMNIQLQQNTPMDGAYRRKLEQTQRRQMIQQRSTTLKSPTPSPRSAAGHGYDKSLHDLQTATARLASRMRSAEKDTKGGTPSSLSQSHSRQQPSHFTFENYEVPKFDVSGGGKQEEQTEQRRGTFGMAVNKPLVKTKEKGLEKTTKKITKTKVPIKKRKPKVRERSFSSAASLGKSEEGAAAGTGKQASRTRGRRHSMASIPAGFSSSSAARPASSPAVRGRRSSVA